MSTLPDLDASEAGITAYWNAIDQGGVEVIDPAQVVAHDNVTAYTLYDNGVEGWYEHPPLERPRSVQEGIGFFFRVKTDGWMVVYLPPGLQYAETVSDPEDLRGPWNLRNYRANETDNHLTGANNNLERIINELRGEFDLSDSMDYQPEDVGIFDFQRPDMDVITQLVGGYGGLGNEEFWPTATMTDGIDLAHLSFYAAGAFASHSDNHLHIEWEGTELADTDIYATAVGAFDGQLLVGPGDSFEAYITQSGRTGFNTDYWVGSLVVATAIWR